MRLSANQRREWLRSRFRDADARYISLFLAIDAESKRLDKVLSSGFVSNSTSGNGRSVSGQSTHAEYQELCGIARDTWEDAVTTLAIDRSETETAKDEDILTAMLADARFQRITNYSGNYMYLAK